MKHYDGTKPGPGEERFGTPHAIHITTDPEDETRYVVVFHNDTCVEPCPVTGMTESDDLEHVLEDFKDGTHLVRFYIRGGGWVNGMHPVDWEWHLIEMSDAEILDWSLCEGAA